MTDPYQPPDVRHVPMPVVFHDEAFCVVDKPAELLACPGTTTVGFDSVVLRVRALFPTAAGPLLVHRLDQPTSGLMVLALTEGVQVALSDAFARRRVDKTYEALVAGPVGESGTISLPLRLDWPNRPRQIVDPDRGKPAVTDWRRLGEPGHHTRLALTPRSGRTHQLRVHCADARGLGTPIVGDRLYGSGPPGRLHLHATWLRFTHPTRGVTVEFESLAPF